jgi:hypothetical protein
MHAYCEVNSKLYTTHVFHKIHLLPLFATAIAMEKSIATYLAIITAPFLHMFLTVLY